MENNVKLLPRTQHGDPFLGMVTAMEARCTMRPYLTRLIHQLPIEYRLL